MHQEEEEGSIEFHSRNIIIWSIPSFKIFYHKRHTRIYSPKFRYSQSTGLHLSKTVFFSLNDSREIPKGFLSLTFHSFDKCVSPVKNVEFGILNERNLEIHRSYGEWSEECKNFKVLKLVSLDDLTDLPEVRFRVFCSVGNEINKCDPVNASKTEENICDFLEPKLKSRPLSRSETSYENDVNTSVEYKSLDWNKAFENERYEQEILLDYYAKHQKEACRRTSLPKFSNDTIRNREQHECEQDPVSVSTLDTTLAPLLSSTTLFAASPGFPAEAYLSLSSTASSHTSENPSSSESYFGVNSNNTDTFGATSPASTSRLNSLDLTAMKIKISARPMRKSLRRIGAYLKSKLIFSPIKPLSFDEPSTATIKSEVNSNGASKIDASLEFNFGDNLCNTNTLCDPSPASNTFQNSSVGEFPNVATSNTTLLTHTNHVLTSSSPETSFSIERFPKTATEKSISLCSSNTTSEALNSNISLTSSIASSTMPNNPDRNEAVSLDDSINSSEHSDEKEESFKPIDPLHCIICVENERNTLFEPCGHLVLCTTCATKITAKCPMCNIPIEKKVKAYLN